MFPTYCFEEMRLPMELLACLLTFLIPFAPKKPRFFRKRKTWCVYYPNNS